MTLSRTIALAAAFAAFATMADQKGSSAEIAALVDEIDADASAAKPAKVVPAAEVRPAVVEKADNEPAEAKPAVQAGNAAEAVKPAPAAEADAPAVTEKQVAKEGGKGEASSKKKSKPKKELTGRDAKITSETMSYDRKEGILFFDRKVYVDDEQYQMHADRVYVFLSGTNDVKRLVALGNVALTNEFRSAACDKAVYVKAASKVVLYAPEGGVATLRDESEKGGTITGSKITFWLDSEQVEVQQSDITVPGGAFKANDAKKLLGK